MATPESRKTAGAKGAVPSAPPGARLSPGRPTRRDPKPPRILVCEPGPAGGPLFSALCALGIEAIVCRDPRSLVELALQRQPDAVIHELKIGDPDELRVLELLRRAAPEAALILVATEESLDTQKLVQKLRPMYYMVGPVEGPELREVVDAALARRARGRG